MLIKESKSTCKGGLAQLDSMQFHYFRLETQQELRVQKVLERINLLLLFLMSS